MKIAFVTSCLESGKDGVGDYTALLAAECERQGHQTALLSLNDPFLRGVSEEPSLLRLSSGLPWGRRVEIASEFMRAFSPACVSLQFVCYGFHPRGIDWRLAGRLKKIIGVNPVEVMFHELWIGSEENPGMKERLVGMLQRRGILDLLRRLELRVTHTSNPAYTALLHRHGIDARLLPLFGSVPVQSGEKPAPRSAEDGWRFGMFGSLHPVWEPEPLFTHLRATGRKITILHAGRPGGGEALWKKLGHDYAGAIEFRALGEMTPEKIAEFFGSIDFGIATTPWEIVGKSATVAAMLEHGLPVVVNRDDVRCPGWREEGYSPLLIKMDDRLAERLAMSVRQPPRRILPVVAGQFLSDIGASA